MYPTSFNTILLLIINIIILTYSFYINKKLYNSYCYISLPFLFNLFFFFFYICTHTYIILSNNIPQYYTNIINLSYISYAAIFATLLNLCFNIGFTLNLFLNNSNNSNIKYIKTFPPNKIFEVGIILFIIGAIAKLIYFYILGNGNIFTYITTYFTIQLERISDSGGASFDVYLNFLFILLDIGTDLLLIHFLNTKKHKYTIVICLCMAILLNFNGRFVMIKLLFQYLIITCIYVKKIREKLPLLFIGIFLPIIFTIVVGLGIYRDNTNNKIISAIDPTYLLMGQFHSMKALADGMEFRNQFGEQTYGKTIILPIIQKPIPRSIWKNKELNAGAIYTKTMYPGSIEQGYAIAPGIAFDAYINFGYLGTLIFFIMLGFILFKIQRFIYINIQDKNNTFYALLAAILGSTLLTLRGADLSNIPVYIMYYIPILLILYTKIKIKI